jgi:hypothetical protein
MQLLHYECGVSVFSAITFSSARYHLKVFSKEIAIAFSMEKPDKHCRGRGMEDKSWEIF